MQFAISYKAVSKKTEQLVSGLLTFENEKYSINGEEIIPCTICKSIPLKTEPQYFENDMVLLEGVVYTIKFGTINISDLLEPEDSVCDDFFLTCFYLDGAHGKKSLNLETLKHAHYVGNKWSTNHDKNMTESEISMTIDSLLNNHTISPESKMTLLKTLQVIKESINPQPVAKDMLYLYVGKPVHLKTERNTDIVIFQEFGENVRFSDITLPLSTYGTEWTICPYAPGKNVSCWHE